MTVFGAPKINLKRNGIDNILYAANDFRVKSLEFKEGDPVCRVSDIEEKLLPHFVNGSLTGDSKTDFSILNQVFEVGAYYLTISPKKMLTSAALNNEYWNLVDADFCYVNYMMTFHDIDGHTCIDCINSNKMSVIYSKDEISKYQYDLLGSIADCYRFIESNLKSICSIENPIEKFLDRYGVQNLTDHNHKIFVLKDFQIQQAVKSFGDFIREYALSIIKDYYIDEIISEFETEYRRGFQNFRFAYLGSNDQTIIISNSDFHDIFSFSANNEIVYGDFEIANCNNMRYAYISPLNYARNWAFLEKINSDFINYLYDNDKLLTTRIKKWDNAEVVCKAIWSLNNSILFTINKPNNPKDDKIWGDLTRCYLNFSHHITDFIGNDGVPYSMIQVGMCPESNHPHTYFPEDPKDLFLLDDFELCNAKNVSWFYDKFLERINEFKENGIMIKVKNPTTGEELDVPVWIGVNYTSDENCRKYGCKFITNHDNSITEVIHSSECLYSQVKGYNVENDYILEGWILDEDNDNNREDSKIQSF